MVFSHGSERQVVRGVLRTDRKFWAPPLNLDTWNHRKVSFCIFTDYLPNQINVIASVDYYECCKHQSFIFNPYLINRAINSGCGQKLLMVKDLSSSPIATHIDLSLGLVPPSFCNSFPPPPFNSQMKQQALVCLTLQLTFEVKTWQMWILAHLIMFYLIWNDKPELLSY